jgi:hypothetical protein
MLSQAPPMSFLLDIVGLHILKALDKHTSPSRALILAGLTYILKRVPRRRLRSKLVRLVETGHITTPFGKDEFRLTPAACSQ